VANAVAPPPDPYAIFLRTRSAVTYAAYPRRIDYTIAVSGVEGGKLKANHYRASLQPGDGTVRIFPISDEELAAPPPHPHDFQFSQVSVQGYTVPVGHPPPNPDLIGVPVLAPTYAFGLAVRPADARGQDDGTAPAGGLPVIAVVSSSARDYAVALLDVPNVDGLPTYHLKLTPLRMPKTNRLRELWVGVDDYLPRKAIVAGNFTLAPLVDIPWTVTFDDASGTLLIATERASATLFLPHHRVVRDAAIAFENVHDAVGSPIGEPLVEPAMTSNTLVEP
jgi:hypothetical protein